MNYNKSNKGLRAIAVFLAIVLVLAAVVGVIAYFSDWFTDWSKFQPEQQEEQLPANENGETASGAFVSEGESNGIKMMTAKIAAADYDEYGISPMAESSRRRSRLQMRKIKRWFGRWRFPIHLHRGQRANRSRTM